MKLNFLRKDREAIQTPKMLFITELLTLAGYCYFLLYKNREAVQMLEVLKEK